MKNNILFIIISTLIGLIAGLLVWIFMTVMHLGITFLWEYIPDKFEIPFYTILICTVGGLLLGIWHKKTGDYPEEMNNIMQEVKEKKRYDASKVPIIFVSSLLPIILGGSIGPEAGLIGIIAGICTWVSDRFKLLTKIKYDLATMGMSASLGAIFGAPLFGIAETIEVEGQPLPKKQKIASYILASVGALLTFKLLNTLYSGSSGLPNFYDSKIGTNEYIGLIFLVLIGIIAGYIFTYSEIWTKKAFKLIKSTVFKSLVAGFLLGLCGTLLPYTMFSGEEQTHILKTGYLEIGATILILTGIIKLILTTVCINGGFKGGHFFPAIFSGISIGYGVSIITSLDPIFCIIIVTTSLLSFLMRKTLAVILLLMMFFPPVCLLPMIIASIVPSFFPIPEHNK